ncbi:hypothetical protein [uncultured Amnibacterium sp.]|uniref:hypothetical protein n=1 Tax=uncultured Amnibacterium sp. TaxID=1631851 RepID=UPI0035CC19F6
MGTTRMFRIRRARLVPVALTTAALCSALIGASVTGTLSAFQASITNSSNTAAAGSLTMQETGSGGTTCLSSSGTNNNYASCSGINKYGGTVTPFTPGAVHTQTVAFANTGVSAVNSFTLAPGTCTKSGGSGSGSASDSTNLCDSLSLTVTCVQTGGPSPATVVNAQTLTAVQAQTYTMPAGCIPQASSGNTITFTFSLAMSTAANVNTVQGQQVSQPLTWTFTGA